MSRKKRINHQGLSGGYLSEAFDGPAVGDRPQPRSHASGNKTLSTTYGLQSQQASVHGAQEKVRCGSLSYANHKYNQSASGIKRGSTAPNGQVNNSNHHGQGRGDMGLSYTLNGTGQMDAASTTIPGGSRHQYNMSSDLSLSNQHV